MFNYCKQNCKLFYYTIYKLKFNLFHGGPADFYNEKVFPDKINSNDYYNHNNEYFIFGHTHLQFIVEYGSNTFINPGSVGLPRNGDFRAHYILLDTQTKNIEMFKNVYDVNKLINYYKVNDNINKLFFHNILFGRTSNKMLKCWDPTFFNYKEETILLKGKYNYFNTVYGVIISNLEDNFKKNVLYIISYLDGTFKITSNTLLFHWQLKQKPIELITQYYNYLSSDKSGFFYEELFISKIELLTSFNLRIDNIFNKIKFYNYDQI